MEQDLFTYSKDPEKAPEKKPCLFVISHLAFDQGNSSIDHLHKKTKNKKTKRKETTFNFWLLSANTERFAFMFMGPASVIGTRKDTSSGEWTGNGNQTTF